MARVRVLEGEMKWRRKHSLDLISRRLSIQAGEMSGLIVIVVTMAVALEVFLLLLYGDYAHDIKWQCFKQCR